MYEIYRASEIVRIRSLYSGLDQNMRYINCLQNCKRNPNWVTLEVDGRVILSRILGN
jgi:hypothetical protein